MAGERVVVVVVAASESVVGVGVVITKANISEYEY